MDVLHVANDIASTAVKVAVGTVIGGAVVAVVPLGIPIITGAVFCGTAALVGEVVDAIFKALGWEGKSGLTHAISRTFTVLIATGLAVGIASCLGFPISLMGGLAIVGVIAMAELAAWLACKIISGIGDCLIRQYEHHKYHHHRHHHV